jgi:hypothetical protein
LPEHLEIFCQTTNLVSDICRLPFYLLLKSIANFQQNG